MESTSFARYDSVCTTAANASEAFLEAFSSSSANANAKHAISSYAPKCAASTGGPFGSDASVDAPVAPSPERQACAARRSASASEDAASSLPVAAEGLEIATAPEAPAPPPGTYLSRASAGDTPCTARRSSAAAASPSFRILYAVSDTTALVFPGTRSPASFTAARHARVIFVFSSAEGDAPNAFRSISRYASTAPA